MEWHTLALFSIVTAIGLHLYDCLNKTYTGNTVQKVICIIIFLIAAYVIFTENIKCPF